MQRERPELRDLTLYAFGDSRAERYGVAGQTYTVREGKPNDHLPARLTAFTEYLAVSATLQWGPWAPYFRPLEGVRPVCYTPDTTIAIYRTADIPGLGSVVAEPRGGEPARVAESVPRGRRGS